MAGGQSVIRGGQATFTADARGRVTFATLAVELDAPQLSVQIVSANGGVASSPATAVSPDAEVHAFLADAAPLNDLGTLTGGSLLAATRADGSPLFPVLASVPSDQQAQAATGVVSAITQCVQAGQGVMPGPDDIKSFVLDLSGDVPAYASSTEPGVVKAPLVGADRLGSLSDWWDSVENDADSFFHGLRHNVGELIAEAGQNARQIEAWLDQLPGFVTGQLTEYGQLADGFFASLETAIDEKIDTIGMPGLKQQTFGSPARARRPRPSKSRSSCPASSTTGCWTRSNPSSPATPRPR